MPDTIRVLVPIGNPKDDTPLGEVGIDMSKQCATCKHKRRDLACKAFGERIPDEILLGKHDHTQPFDGDNGILYEEID